MNSGIKAAWVAALRSGKYIQGKCSLKQVTLEQTTHCCLGVLAELHKEATQSDESLTNRFSLSSVVQDWAGVTDNFGGTVSIEGLSLTLAGHNDEERRPASFAQIADAIEAQL